MKDAAVIGLDGTNWFLFDLDEVGRGGEGKSELISKIAERLFGLEPAVVLVAGIAIHGVATNRSAIDI